MSSGGVALLVHACLSSSARPFHRWWLWLAPLFGSKACLEERRLSRTYWWM